MGYTGRDHGRLLTLVAEPAPLSSSPSLSFLSLNSDVILAREFQRASERGVQAGAGLARAGDVVSSSGVIVDLVQRRIRVEGERPF